MEKDKINRGRTLLMLRLPSARVRLAQATSPAVLELIGAYEVAHSAGQRFGFAGNTDLENEYRGICLEIEGEVLALLNGLYRNNR